MLHSSLDADHREGRNEGLAQSHAGGTRPFAPRPSPIRIGDASRLHEPFSMHDREGTPRARVGRVEDLLLLCIDGRFGEIGGRARCGPSSSGSRPRSEVAPLRNINCLSSRLGRDQFTPREHLKPSPSETTNHTRLLPWRTMVNQSPTSPAPGKLVLFSK